MKAFLLHPDRDFDATAELSGHAAELAQDLELRPIILAAADGDELIHNVVTHALLTGLTDPGEVVYRQEMLADSQQSPDLIRELYTLAGNAIASERTVFRPLTRDAPSSVLSRSVTVLQIMTEFLERLRSIADEHAPAFRSPGFRRFFAMIGDELDDDYLARLHDHLDELEFKPGKLISARLGAGNRSISYVARRHPPRNWLARMGVRRPSGYSFTIPSRDEAGFQALRDLEDRGVNEIANAVAQACDHVLSFFAVMRTELAFYVGALNLCDRLTAAGAPTCLADIAPAGRIDFSASELYDVALALTLGRAPVGNDVAGEDRSLVMLTGANQGGKSTLLRAIGQAQLMGQAGLIAGASALRLNLCSSVFTHYKREEDASMQSGKLDEELARMSTIADAIAPGGMLLCNESFSSTNEREGSEIARQIVSAMLDSGVKVAFVTHQYDLAHGFWAGRGEHSLFLRAGREHEGQRNYRLAEGEPLPTSYGADSYRKVFGREPGSDTADVV